MVGVVVLDAIYIHQDDQIDLARPLGCFVLHEVARIHGHPMPPTYQRTSARAREKGSTSHERLHARVAYRNSRNREAPVRDARRTSGAPNDVDLPVAFFPECAARFPDTRRVTRCQRIMAGGVSRHNARDASSSARRKLGIHLRIDYTLHPTTVRSRMRNAR